jgi:hypothetical protein
VINMISRLDGRSSINFHLFQHVFHISLQLSTRLSVSMGFFVLYPQAICFIFSLVMVELLWRLTCYNWSSCGFIFTFSNIPLFKFNYFNNTPTVFLGVFIDLPLRLFALYLVMLLLFIVLVELCLCLCWLLTCDWISVGVLKVVLGFVVTLSLIQFLHISWLLVVMSCVDTWSFIYDEWISYRFRWKFFKVLWSWDDAQNFSMWVTQVDCDVFEAHILIVYLGDCDQSVFKGGDMSHGSPIWVVPT